ncbi:hypothetical protein K9M79_08125 [Candidatus Woesearchaeota archaeon]|nr:hypothetical protein [Candidatus Woesearchaeota archaeon]
MDTGIYLVFFAAVILIIVILAVIKKRPFYDFLEPMNQIDFSGVPVDLEVNGRTITIQTSVENSKLYSQHGPEMFPDLWNPEKYVDKSFMVSKSGMMLLTPFDELKDIFFTDDAQFNADEILKNWKR